MSFLWRTAPGPFTNADVRIIITAPLLLLTLLLLTASLLVSVRIINQFLELVLSF